MKRIWRFYSRVMRSLCPTDWKFLFLPMIAIRITTFIRPKGGYLMKRALIGGIGVVALLAGVQDFMRRLVRRPRTPAGNGTPASVRFAAAISAYRMSISIAATVF